MELANNISAILILAVFFVILWVFYFWFYQQYRIDRTRQEIFALRDELFDFASAGNVSFDHRSYMMLRTTMNGMIRFAHRINLVTLLVITLLNAKNTGIKPFNILFKESLADLTPQVQEELIAYLWRMNEVVVKHLVKSSLILMAITCAFFLILPIFKGIGSLWQIIASNFPGISRLDNEAALRGLN